MTKTTDIVEYKSKDGQQLSLSFDSVQKYLVRGSGEASKQEIMYFIGICKSRGLNPYKKDCYLIKFGKEPAAIITSIDFLRSRARAQPDCKGWKRGVIVQKEDGELRYSNGLVLPGETLLGGWAEAQPEGWSFPMQVEVNLSGYIKKTNQGEITAFWKPEKQPTMIQKVAESQLLRSCWPDQFQGMYTDAEIGSQEEVIDVTHSFVSKDEPESELLVTVDDFDAQVPNHINMDHLEDFLKRTAKANGTTVEQCKISAMEDFHGFLAVFKRWSTNFHSGQVSGQKQDQKQPESTNEDDPLNPKHWTNLKQSGFSTFVHKNLELIKQAPLETINNMRDKWGRIYETNVFPLDKDKPKEEPTPQPENNEPSKMEQLFINYTERIDSAKNEGEIEIILNDIETDLHTLKLNNVMAERLKDTAENQRKRLKDNW